jgi:hypothetical protein
MSLNSCQQQKEPSAVRSACSLIVTPSTFQQPSGTDCCPVSQQVTKHMQRSWPPAGSGALTHGSEKPDVIRWMSLLILISSAVLHHPLKTLHRQIRQPPSLPICAVLLHKRAASQPSLV